MGGLTNFAIVCDFLSALILIGVARRSASIFRTLTSFCKDYSLSDKHVFVPKYITTTGGPLLTLFFETLEKQPCKQRSDLVLNGHMRVPK